MSNYLSQPFQPTKVESTFNAPLADKVLNVLQGKYDANKAKVDQQLALYKNQLRGLRDEDNQYIAARLKEADSLIKSYSNRDYSLSSTTDTLTNSLRSITEDPIIQNAVINRAKVDQYNLQVDEIKKKDPKFYNNANYQYGLAKAGVDEYKKGNVKQVGDLSYIPYTDLTEEHLKKLKTIKEVKGKRFIEQIVNENGTPDSNGKYKVRKEIDGLTDTEIQSYFGSLMTSQELTQMQINGWAKYAQPSAIEDAKNTYSEFNKQLIDKKSENLRVLELRANNANLGDDVQRQAKIDAEALKEGINNLKDIDVSKLNPETIAFELEKNNYLNGISQIASNEWSQTVDKNEVYYADANLDIARQKLEMDKEKLQIEKTKLAKDFAVDANGNPLTDGVVAQSSKATELVKEMTDEGTGAVSLKREHDLGYNGIIETAREFLTTASPKDRQLFLEDLKSRGINENLQFEDKNKNINNSLANTLYESFKDNGFDTTYGEFGKRMISSYNQKQQKAKDIITVNKEAYKNTFNKNPDGYLTKIVEETMINTADMNLQDKDLKILQQKKQQVQNLYKKATGKDLNIKLDMLGQAQPVGTNWFKVKQELKSAINKSPELLEDLANIKEYTGKESLKADAKAEKEKVIQKRTKEGIMMSAYNEYTFLNDKVKEKVINTIPEGRVTIDGETTFERIDVKQPISFYKSGDNIIINQTQKVGSGSDASKKMLQVVLDKNDAAYQEVLQYVDLTNNKKELVASPDSTFSMVKVRMTSHTQDETVKDKKVASIQVNTSPALKNAFILPPEYFATKETAQKSIEYTLSQKGVQKEAIDKFSNTLMSKINTYTLQPETDLNRFGTGYEFNLKVVKTDGTLLFKTSLGTNKMDENLNYLINSHPHIFIINQMLYKATSNPKEIESLINTL